MTPYIRALDIATAAAEEAAALVLAEFEGATGLRGHGDHADVDSEIEGLIRDALEGLNDDWGILGEELTSRDRPATDPEHHVWLIDPQDGTSAALRGYRGSAVSIGLLRDGLPVLGVVASCTTPNRFAWAEGTPLLRWSAGCEPREVIRAPWAEALTSEHTVFVSQSADRRTGGSLANIECCTPARPRACASIAHRLALVAVGEGEVATSLAGPGAWDYCAGHALLRASGGELVDQNGAPVRYARDGRSGTRACFGGAPGVVSAIARRDWDGLLARAGTGEEASPPPQLWFDSVRARPDAERLDRAQGCLLGQLAGDSLGSLVEFQEPGTIALAYPQGVRRLADGGVWKTLAGQPTDDSELALLLARSLVEQDRFDIEHVARAYAGWYTSGPFDIGGTTANALSAAARAVEADAATRQGKGAAPRRYDTARTPVATAAMAAAVGGAPNSQANGALMRISPLAIAGVGMPDEALARRARADAALTHSHPVCGDANAVFAVTVARAIRDGSGPSELYEGALAYAREHAPSVVETLEAAAQGPPEDYVHQMGWVRIALRNAYHQLLSAPNLEEGLSRTVAGGGDTDTNAAIAGALLGAVHGRRGVPRQWTDRVLTCRPAQGTLGVARPRPRRFWPVDALGLAERLLMLTLVALLLIGCVANEPVDFYDRDLSVREVYPNPEHGTVPRNAQITVRFNAYLDPEPLTYFNALTLDSGGVRASDRAVYEMVGKRATIITRRDLEAEIFYDLGFNDEVLRSVTGRPYAGPRSIRFEVGDFRVAQPSAAPIPTWTQVAPILEPCGECHDDPEWMLPRLTREAMAGVPSAQRPELWIVKPGDPARSYLMHKILWDYPVRDGTAQPPAWAGFDQLSIAEQETLERWIQGGAL